MALSVYTGRPVNGTESQLGVGTIAGGSANADAALADNSDSTYVQLAQRVRLDQDVIRVSFATPSLPAGAKVTNVWISDRVQTVQTTTVNPYPPVPTHWLRCKTGVIQVAGEALKPKKVPFTSLCPSTTTTTTPWIDRDHTKLPAGPGGAAWDVATNLTSLTYEVGRSDDYANNLRYAAVYLNVEYQRISTVTVTGPTGSSTSTRPTVTWTYASPDSQPQQAYRVAIYTSAQVSAPGFTPFVTQPQQDSGWLLGEDLQWTLTQDIVDGSYAAYVQATSKWAGAGDFPTATASTTWTRAAAPASPPPSPTLASITYDAAGTGRVPLTATPGGPTPATTVFTWQRSTDNELTWDSIPSLTYKAANGMSPVTVYDYTAPMNVLCKYRAIAYTGTPYVASALPSSVQSVTPIGDQHALIHPSNPLLNTIIPVAAPKAGEGIKITRRMMQGTFQPIGGTGKVLPIVLQGPYFGFEFSLELIFVNGEDSWDLWEPVNQIITSGSVLQFKRPTGDQYWVSVGPGVSGQDMEQMYDAVPGNPRKDFWRRLKLTLTEVRSPNWF